jgi:hypothetical protein
VGGGYFYRGEETISLEEGEITREEEIAESETSQ